MLIRTMAIALLLGLAVGPVSAEGPLYTNVRDFGAKGDNVTDDTAAIQAAFNSNPAGCVLFPAGSYRIRDVIKMSGGSITGVGAASIYQETAGKDIFYADFAWRMIISGLTFNRGACQLNLGNLNTDQGLVEVRDCNFMESSGVAVQMREKSASTLFVVKDCKFSMCDQSVISHCDQSAIRDCWITSAFMKDKAVIENKGGRMVCDGILGVPLVTGADQRWIDNYGLLICRSFRFGGEFGGFTPVVNYGKYAENAGGPSVVLEDCWVSAIGNKKRTCAVYCEEVPNIISIRNCQLSGVPPVIVSPSLDMKTYFDYAMPGMLSYEFAGNSGEFAASLPKAMLNAAAHHKPGPRPIPGQLDEKQTKAALDRAVKAASALQSAGQPWTSDGHVQKTDPRDYMQIPFENWWTGDLMDGQSFPNSQYIAIAPAGERRVIVHRAEGLWPHVLIRDVTIDLDKTPFLTWKLLDSGYPSATAIRIIDRDTQRMMLLSEIHQHADRLFDYKAVDLRKAFDLNGGKRTFDIRLYTLGLNIISATKVEKAKPGDYQIVDFIRAEAP